MSFLRTVAVVMRKDLIVETRSREVLYTSALFAVLCVLVFAFGFVHEGRAESTAAAAILWIAIAFAGTLALARVFDRERQNETLRALLLAPVARPALYVGKLAGVLTLLLIVEALLVPLVALWFQAPVFRHGAVDGRVDSRWIAGLCRSRNAVCRHAGAVAQPRRACCRFCCIPLPSR